MPKISKILILALIVLTVSFAVSQIKIAKSPLNVKTTSFKNNESFNSISHALAAPSKPKIESKIHEELILKEKVRVVVILKEDLIATAQKLSKEELILKKEKIKEKQDKVLLALSKPDFKLKNKYKAINAFSGLVTKNGIKKLENHPDVEIVHLDKRAHAALSESVPLINADDVWTSGYTGNGETVCVIDSGVDYTHSDLGDSSCGISITGDVESRSLESPHPYPNNYDYTWTITGSGFTNIAVHFSSINLEKSYDFLYIEDASGNLLQEFGRDAGIYNDIWSVSIPGDTIKIHLVTDFSIQDNGFVINQVLNGVVSEWTNCGQIIGGYDFVNEDDDPMDDDGHGTHVAGIIASQNSTYKGVAPGTNIVAAKVLDSAGSGWFSDIAASIDWCINNKDTYNISIINMSIGEGSENNDPTTQCDGYLTANAIALAKSLDIITFVASGNEGHLNGISYPACASAAVSIGAVYDADIGKQKWLPTCQDQTTSADKMVCFTNRDEILDLLAPGCRTTSSSLGGGTVGYCGTSMAAPHTAGAAALLLEAYPGLTPDQLKNVLKNTGINIYDSATGLTFPRIDAKAALDSLSPAVSISITSDGLVEFGTVALGAMKTNDSGDIQTISVDTGPADLKVRSTDFSDGVNDWVIGDQVIWEYSENGADWSEFLIADNPYPLDSNVPQAETRNLHLRITMPAVADSSNQYSSTVTIVATAP
ncbi:S8 family serine peptidase [Candidatus Parcubacteria bacterium]|nr:S8 family serine peptidase [Candidatus Parcubacteria bacterium]